MINDTRIRLSQALLVPAAFALVTMVAVTICDIVARAAFSTPIVGTLEIVELSLAISLFLSLPEVCRLNMHIAVDLIDGFVGPAGVRLLHRIAAIAWVVLLMLLAYQAAQQAYDAWRFGDQRPDLGTPLWVFWTPACFGLLFSALIEAASFVRARPSTLEQPQ
ncbi:TRAP transporter small permease [Microvirga sp. 2YAF29]|uniref:TRAP transporter small permease n=1 Tax=Microvirga sp. 2YAF29 TaxID=3233031 RepID=UPI003F9AF002